MQHVRHPSDEAKLREGGRFDQAKVDRVCDFIEKYLYLDNGKPLVLLPYHREVIASWYGWIRPDGFRYTKLGLLTCAKKNAKSVLTYALSAYHLLADDEPSPSCVSCAVDKQQAKQIFDWFRFSIDQNPKLRSALHYREHKAEIVYPKKNGRYISLTSRPEGKHGTGQSFIVYDEMAFWPKGDALYLAMKGNTQARPNGLQVITSTAGWDKNSTFYKMVEYGRKVLSGEVIDTSFQPFIYEVPESADLDSLTDDEIRAGNPGIGVTHSFTDYRARLNLERHDPTLRLSFDRLHCNRWTDSQEIWIPPRAWEACKGEMPDLEGKEIIMAVDVGAVRDLTAVTVMHSDKGTHYLKSWAFVPEQALTSRDSVNRIQYETFRKEGSLTVLPGKDTDLELVHDFIGKLLTKYKVKLCVFDKWNALATSNFLKYKGITTYDFRQTHAYFNSPCIEFERLVGKKKIVHDGSALLRWQIGHTTLDRNHQGFVKPVTARHELKKDNLITAIMCLSHALQQDPNPKALVGIQVW